MPRFIRTAAILVAVMVTSFAAADDKKRPMQVDDLFKFKRVGAPQLSPDGKLVAYHLTTVDLDANKSSAAIYIADTEGKNPPKAITDPKGKKDTSPRFSPDGKSILFQSNRSGTSQLWLIPITGGDPRQITSISTGAESAIWSPDGTKIAFVSAVYPEFSEKPFAESDKLNKEKEEAIEKSPVKAKTFTRLFYRHWDSYVEDKRQHLYVQRIAYAPQESPERPEEAFAPRDVTPGDRDAFPTSTTFGTDTDFTFSPDGKFLVFTAVPEKGEAWTTNYDICRVSITNTSTKWEALTAGNKAADGSPQFSPDGKRLAYRAQMKAGYEADKWNLLSAECNPDGTLKSRPMVMTGDRDLSVNEFAWGPNGGIVFGYDFDGAHSVMTALPDGKLGPAMVIKGAGFGFKTGALVVSSLTTSPDGLTLAYSTASMAAPADIEVRRFDPNGGGTVSVMRTTHNKALLDQLDRPEPEAVYIPVEGDVKMHMWILKPPGFDPAKKWPVAFLVHGGPQGAWENSWSFRWNPEVWAARGYVVVMPNPRGSTGFGQKFVDEITADWGGKCYRDLVAGLDYVEKLPYVDKDRIGAAGASFGGYMMDWFAVNDIAPRFKCLISHCSVWNFESMWGTTDELWFDEFEHGGLPWEKPGKYREFSPHIKAGNLAKYKTPMLVIQNDLDFRCPIGQGHELFTALQRQGVPSRMVNFPDEGHWVLKPQNSKHWHKEVFAWLEKYCPPGGK